MSRHPLVHPRWLLIAPLVILLLGQAGCTGGLQPTPTAILAATPAATPTKVLTPAMVTKFTPEPSSTGTAGKAVTTPTSQSPAGARSGAAPSNLSNLPAQAFRYEVSLTPASSAEQGIVLPPTLITGQYKNGAWQQTVQSGTVPGQESVVSGGATFTRQAGQQVWTHWSSISFDDAYGLTSPFTILRLYALAQPKVRGTLEAVSGAPEATFRTQVVVPATTIADFLKTGVAAVAPDADTRTALGDQVAPMAITQTLTFWTGESGRIYRAAATLLAADSDGQPAPWMEATWRFWNYDDAEIAVTAPTAYTEATTDAPTDVASTPSGEPTNQATGVAISQGVPANLIVHVFAWPGKPAQDLAVTVYPAGDSQQPIDWRTQADSEFTLPPGNYDVRVQMNYAEEWVRGIEVSTNSVINRDVTFDFGTLELSVLRSGSHLPVDIVTYPAGSRDNWVDWRSDNPASIQLRAGSYDVEIAYDDHKASQTITGLVVKTGETTKKQIEVAP